MRAIDEQVILITGATDGLGKEVARSLAQQGATLLLHGLNQARGDRTLREIQEATGNNKLIYYQADYARKLEQLRLRRLAAARKQRS